MTEKRDDGMPFEPSSYNPPPVEVQCAVMGAKMLCSLAGYGVWRLFGGKKENYPGVVDIF